MRTNNVVIGTKLLASDFPSFAILINRFFAAGIHWRSKDFRFRKVGRRAPCVHNEFDVIIVN